MRFFYPLRVLAGLCLLAFCLCATSSNTDTRKSLSRSQVLTDLRKRGVLAHWREADCLAVTVAPQSQSSKESLRERTSRGLNYTLGVLLEMRCLPNGVRYLVWDTPATNWIILDAKWLADYRVSPEYSRAPVVSLLVDSVLLRLKTDDPH